MATRGTAKRSLPWKERKHRFSRLESLDVTRIHPETMADWKAKTRRGGVSIASFSRSDAAEAYHERPELNLTRPLREAYEPKHRGSIGHVTSHTYRIYPRADGGLTLVRRSSWRVKDPSTRRVNVEGGAITLKLDISPDGEISRRPGDAPVFRYEKRR